MRPSNVRVASRYEPGEDRLLLGGEALARDQIRIVGSSTVFPFSSAVAESFGRGGGFKTPVVESTGTGGGIKQFCSGVGVQHPDITNASRRIKKSEFDDCAKNGVKDIIEIQVGVDGEARSPRATATPTTSGRVDRNWPSFTQDGPNRDSAAARPRPPDTP